MDDDGQCLVTALQNTTTIIVCDSSYQFYLNNSIWSAAWTIECTDTSSRAVGVTPTTATIANAYQSEWLYATLATVLAVTTLYSVKHRSLTIGCDNERSLYLSSFLELKVPVKCQHSNVLCSIRLVRSKLSPQLTSKHIKAHQDYRVLHHKLSREVQVNIDCDSAAKVILIQFHH